MKILILSDEEDLSTNDVIDWISYYDFQFVRINETSDINFSFFSIINSNEVEWEITIDGSKFNSSEIHSYWYRRGFIVINYDEYEKNDLIKIKMNKYLNQEMSSINKSINSFLNNSTYRIGSFNDNFINKIDILKVASECGLCIPDTLVTTSKKKLIEFGKKHSFLITKAIGEGIALKYNENQINGFTNRIDPNELEEIENLFFPTLFQEGLSKKWELRIFYLKGKCYSSAIFSQKDKKTEIDFRHYGSKYPNRTPPYKLPKEIEKMIIKLMNTIGMQSGSIDIVYTKDNRYVFLEVNPVGQFAQVSDPCNYYLEEKIAKALIYEN